MKELIIHNRKQEKFIVLVDDEDYGWLSKISWYISKESQTYYAKNDSGNKKNRKRIRMHREIMKRHNLMVDSDFIDHKDHNGLNNQKSNLRKCLKKENNRNISVRISDDKSSKYKGVSWHAHRNKWHVQITCDGTVYNLGSYNSEDIAGATYNLAAIKLFKEFALLNDIDNSLGKDVNFSKNKKTSEYSGVSWYSAHGKWYAEITVDYEKIRLGAYNLESDAAIAYNNYVINHKLNRKLNKVNV